MNNIKIGAVSLGCSKNTVDTELMLGKLVEHGYELTSYPEEADIIIINTCSFINDAKEESVNTILEMAELKKSSNLRGIIVTGCLSGRFREELVAELPEIDAFLGVTPHEEIVETVEKVLEKIKVENYHEAVVKGDYANRVLTTPMHYAYVKISEGCNNRCSYCVIPYIRGNLKSREIEDIHNEVCALADKGVREIVLVAQDTSKYGLDLYGKSRIVDLLEDLSAIRGISMIRLLYCYPDGVTDSLLECIISHDNIANYIDMPIQHIDDTILRAMHRADTKKTIYDAVRNIRSRCPDFIIRSTVITGFPGETDEQFEVLRQGIEDLEFDRLGAFAYSREEGTPAAEMDNQIDDEIKQDRREQIMLLQQEVSLKRNTARVGKNYKCIVDYYDGGEGIYYARSYAEAPEVDNLIIIKSDKDLQLGKYYDVKIVDADNYDLFGEVM